jgi:hypothetical protein
MALNYLLQQIICHASQLESNFVPFTIADKKHMAVPETDAVSIFDDFQCNEVFANCYFDRGTKRTRHSQIGINAL